MKIAAFLGAVTLSSFVLAVVVLYWLAPGAAASTAAGPAASAHAAMASAQNDEQMPMSHAAMGHDHPLVATPEGSPTPRITHLMFPDAMDGYNIQILTENFTFTPAAINRDNIANTGHAHLYVNGQKIARIYDSWFHLPSDHLIPGANAVSITLNANDHGTWAEGATPITSTVIVYQQD